MGADGKGRGGEFSRIGLLERKTSWKGARDRLY